MCYYTCSLAVDLKASFVSACVCLHSSFHDAEQGGKRTLPMALLLHYRDFHTAVLMIRFCLHSDIMSAHLKFDLTSLEVVLTWPVMFIHAYIYNYFELKFQQQFLISVTLKYYTL